MAKAKPIIPQQRLVELITLFRAFNEVPEQPHDNNLKSVEDASRQLSFDREKHIASSLAFISALNDRPADVMAVCVEERADPPGLDIRIACNSGNLADITTGLKRIAETLQRATSREVTTRFACRDLLHQIVQMNLSRVLSRLRSKHATRSRKNAGKAPLTQMLHAALYDDSIRLDQLKIKSLSRLRLQSSSLTETFSIFELSKVGEKPSSSYLMILADLTRQAYTFRTNELSVMLRASKVDPSIREFLCEAIEKLGQYYSTAVDLIRAARNPKYTIFRSIAVYPLKGPNVDSDAIRQRIRSFDDVIRENTAAQHEELNLKHYEHVLSVGRARFQQRLERNNGLWSVHAEIQLLLHYERAPKNTRPRFICSSKKACYLCNLFIELHGCFHTPDTHGRVYDKWILPDTVMDPSRASTRILMTLDRFSILLRDKMLETIQSRSIAYRHPNESRTIHREVWSSTSTVQMTSARQLLQGPPREPLESITSSVETVAHPDHPISRSTSSMRDRSEDDANRLTNWPDAMNQDAEEAPPSQSDGMSKHSTSVASHCMTGLPSGNIRNLPRGESLIYERDSIPPEIKICAGSLNLYIQWTRDSAELASAVDSRPDFQWLHINRQSTEHFASNEHPKIRHVAVGNLPETQDAVFDIGNGIEDPSPLAITRGEDTVVLRWSSGNSFASI